MVKYLNKIALFFALVAVIDVACGFGFNVLKKNAKGGDTHKNYYIAEECCDDILILGSSRAARHYDPRIIEEEIGMSCYNCGEAGCGIITAYARYQLIAQRHKPKCVIYEVTPNFDYYKTDDYSKYLGRIRQYAEKPPVRKMFVDLGDELEPIRLMSNMYRNNSFIIHNLVDNIERSSDRKGYEPLSGTLKADARDSKNSERKEIDNIKYSYMEKLIVNLKKDSIPIIFYVSPRCADKEMPQKDEYNLIVKLCNKYQIPFINHEYYEGISTNRELFHDFGHMNNEGSILYTRHISEEIRDIINKEKSIDI